MEKILCPINFSDTSLNAMEYAANIGGMHRSSITLLHVITNSEYNEVLKNTKDSDVRQKAEDYQLEVERKLQSLCREIKSLDNGLLDCKYAITYGSVVDKTVEYATENAFLLIVMGTDGVNDVTEAIDGSRTVKVIEQSPCPVLCVPNNASFNGINKIVYGTEMHKLDKEVLQQLVYFTQSNATIHMVHLVASEKDKPKYKHYEEELRSYVPAKKIYFQVKHWDDEVRAGLDEVMVEEQADLLVLLTHQRNFFQRIFDKSVVKGMSYFANYPILVFLEENLRD